jgi:hypothetical protein
MRTWRHSYTVIGEISLLFHVGFKIAVLYIQYKFPALFFCLLVGFGRACAPVRCAQPSFWLIDTQKGALRAPPPLAHRSFAAPVFITLSVYYEELYSFHHLGPARR